jgi:hypothetical protein
MHIEQGSTSTAGGDTAAPPKAGSGDAPGETAAAQGAKADAAPPAIDVVELMARLAKSEAKVADLEADQKKTRDKKRAAEAERTAALESQGEFKTLADERAAVIQSLKAQSEADAADATRWRAYLEVESARIDVEAKRLPDGQRKILAKLSDVTDRSEALRVFLAESSAASAPEIPSGAPATNGESIGSRLSRFRSQTVPKPTLA